MMYHQIYHTQKEPNTTSAGGKDMHEHSSDNKIDKNDIRTTENNQLTTQHNINTSSLVDNDTYELEKYEKNAMIIFNHENFLVGEKRLGTSLDVAALEDTFRQFRFEVVTRNDCTKKDLFDKLKQFSKMNFNNYGCICVAILTHGQDGGFLRAYDTRYNERDIFSCFDALTNPTLVAKPIIFLIQACRGSTTAARLTFGPIATNLIAFDTDSAGNECRPTESDIIIFHSSFFGRASVRVVAEGSWFIQTVCEQMKQHGATDHVEKLFRRVRRTVALHKEYKGIKQMPAVTTTLLKKLYLKKVTSEIDGSNISRANPHVITSKKIEVKNAEFKRSTVNVILTNFLRFVLGTLLTLLIAHKDATVTSCILLAFVFKFQLIRYKANDIYFAFFKPVHRLTMFLVFYNVYFRMSPYYFERYLTIDVYVYLVGCLYSMGLITEAMYVALMSGTIYVIYETFEFLCLPARLVTRPTKEEIPDLNPDTIWEFTLT